MPHHVIYNSAGLWHLQIRQREQQQEELRQQASRPFARTADDADRDMNLRERVRFGDPFADKIQRSQPAAMPAPIVPAHMRKQMKKSGFVVPSVRPLTHWSCFPSSMACSWYDALSALLLHLSSSCLMRFEAMTCRKDVFGHGMAGRGQGMHCSSM